MRLTEIIKKGQIHARLEGPKADARLEACPIGCQIGRMAESSLSVWPSTAQDKAIRLTEIIKQHLLKCILAETKSIRSTDHGILHEISVRIVCRNSWIENPGLKILDWQMAKCCLNISVNSINHLLWELVAPSSKILVMIILCLTGGQALGQEKGVDSHNSKKSHVLIY